MASFDLVGGTAILNFPEKKNLSDKKKIAKDLIATHKNIKTVLEKVGKIKGRLRIFKTRHLAGKKTKDVLYKENNCLFKFNIDRTYFSPRLSNERLEIAKKIKRKDNVLVMFAGVAPFSIVIAKIAKPKIVYSVELNRQASKYAQENVKLNKLEDKVQVIQGDVKKVIPKFKKKFDVIVMPRPQLKESFLEQAFQVSKKGTRIFYYGFEKEGNEKKIVEQIESEAKKSKKRVKIEKVKKAGNIAPYKYRYRVEFKII